MASSCKDIWPKFLEILMKLLIITKNLKILIIFVKLPKEDATLNSAGRVFHSLDPRKEKHFCPFTGYFFGNVKSVSVFRRLQ